MAGYLESYLVSEDALLGDPSDPAARQWWTSSAGAWSAAAWPGTCARNSSSTALEVAISRRRPSEGLVHHSGRGTQCTSLGFGRRAREAGIDLSMGSVGDAYDNALAESFFASLETELIDHHSWRTRAEAKLAVFDYIEAFQNPQRRHSALDHLSPAELERRYRSETSQSAA